MIGKQLKTNTLNTLEQFFRTIVIGVQRPDRIAQGVNRILRIGLNLFQNGRYVGLLAIDFFLNEFGRNSYACQGRTDFIMQIAGNFVPDLEERMLRVIVDSY